MSQRSRRICIIGVCVTALLAVAILPLQADAKSKPAPKTAAAKAAATKKARVAKAKAAKARAAKVKAAKARAARARATRLAAARKAAAAKAAADAARRAASTTTTTRPKPAAPVTPLPAPLPTPAPNPSPAPAPCVGVAMNNGQADINAHGPGTTYCLSGAHNWTLDPKSGDRLIGPAVLDGGNSAKFAIQSWSSNNVELVNLEIRNYRADLYQGAIRSQGGTGWTLRDLKVHDNGTSAGGSGSALGSGWKVIGGRYYNNRQEAFGGTAGNAVLDGVEIDHNNFTDSSYTKRNTDCGYEAGGFKWVTNNITVKNSSIHDNACRGLWVDGSAKNAVITNNRVFNNWDEGIFIEISSNATITGNTVYNNGWRCYEGNGSTCIWMLGGGITLLSSNNVEIANNNLYGNFNGITLIQSTRNDGNPGVLRDNYIHDNTVSGPSGKTGLVTTNGGNLAGTNTTFANNTFTNGMNFCHLTC
jgi:parallel beta-helix repeat protein